jgi:hypothetical protein
LFPGLGYAAGYKVSQRIYKFGGQPWFNDLITKHYKTQFTNTFGERKGKMMMQATAGRYFHIAYCPPGADISFYLSLTGIGEVVCRNISASLCGIVYVIASILRCSFHSMSSKSNGK